MAAKILLLAFFFYLPRPVVAAGHDSTILASLSSRNTDAGTLASGGGRRDTREVAPVGCSPRTLRFGADLDFVSVGRIASGRRRAFERIALSTALVVEADIGTRRRIRLPDSIDAGCKLPGIHALKAPLLAAAGADSTRGAVTVITTVRTFRSVVGPCPRLVANLLLIAAALAMTGNAFSRASPGIRVAGVHAGGRGVPDAATVTPLGVHAANALGVPRLAVAGAAPIRADKLALFPDGHPQIATRVHDDLVLITIEISWLRLSVPAASQPDITIAV